jgi:hypothetical protein
MVRRKPSLSATGPARFTLFPAVTNVWRSVSANSTHPPYQRLTAMNPKTIALIIALPLLFTAAAVILWARTDYHAYTKYQVVERVPVEPADDIFAATGLFDSADGAPAFRTVQRDSFHFGLLPTPQGLLDKHVFSVLTIAGPPWAIAFGIIGWLVWRRRRSRPLQE